MDVSVDVWMGKIDRVFGVWKSNSDVRMLRGGGVRPISWL